MRKFLLLFVSISLIAVAGNRLQAQDYKTALGVRLSSSDAYLNNSISFKYFLNESAALEGLVSFGDPVSIGALYEIHKPLNVTNLKWFYGAGAYIGFPKAGIALGGTGVVGLDYKFQNIPVNLSLDWKPELNLISSVEFRPGAFGLTARFTFGEGKE